MIKGWKEGRGNEGYFWFERACMWRRTGGCSPTGPREPELDQKCSDGGPTSTTSGFCDCNGNDLQDSAEPSYGCGQATTKCSEMCKAACNPSTCSAGLTCVGNATACCAEGDWDCCQSGDDKFGRRLYCPKDWVMCNSGKCLRSESACAMQGGARYGARLCPAP